MANESEYHDAMVTFLEMIWGAGFINVEMRDRSDWFQRKVQEEYEFIQSELYPKMLEAIGQQNTDHFVENWRSMVVVCAKGEMLQVYGRAQKPS